MSQGPEFSLLSEAARIVNTRTETHAKDRIGGIYSGLRGTLALVGITPENAKVKPQEKPHSYHFIDIPGVFYIGYYGEEADPFLLVRRVIDLNSGGYVGEDFKINPEGNIGYTSHLTDPRGFDYNWLMRDGFMSLRASENASMTLDKFDELANQLDETVNKEGQRPQDIRQEVREAFPHLTRAFRKRKNLDLPDIGPVKAFFAGRAKTNDRIVYILERQRAELLVIHEDGQGSINAGDDVAYIHSGDSGLKIRDPHFLAVKLRELKEALDQVA